MPDPLACDWLRALLDLALVGNIPAQERCIRHRDTIPGMKLFVELLNSAADTRDPIYHEAAGVVADAMVSGMATIEAGQDAARATLRTLTGATR